MRGAHSSYQLQGRAARHPWHPAGTAKQRLWPSRGVGWRPGEREGEVAHKNQ